MSGAQAESPEMPFCTSTQAELSYEAELLRLQQEMETIAYITSHDLQAPVRIMEYAHSALKESLGTSAGPDTEEALRVLQAQITNMRVLHKGLQDYIQLETFAPQHVELDANELMATVMDIMRE